jgi:hypothetical protein
MIRKILIAAVALVALMAAPAARSTGGLTVNPGSVRPGGNADFAGKGCQPGETVVIRLDGTTVSTVTSDTSGEFSAPSWSRLPAGVHRHLLWLARADRSVTVLSTAVTPPRSSGTCPAVPESTS